MDTVLEPLQDFVKEARRDSFYFQGWPVEAFVHDLETLDYFMEAVDRPAGIPSLADMIMQGISVPGESAFANTANPMCSMT